MSLLAVVIGVAGTLVAWAARTYLYWWGIRRRAERIIADPDPESPTDPNQAVCDAMVQRERPRIRRTSGEIRLRLNGKANGKHE